MSKEETNLSIPPSKQMAALFDLLIENLATQQVFFDLILSKLINISDPDLTKDRILDIIYNASLSNKEFITANRKEIMASLMLKYAE